VFSFYIHFNLSVLIYIFSKELRQSTLSNAAQVFSFHGNISLAANIGGNNAIRVANAKRFNFIV
jgi:hypothetical protein